MTRITTLIVASTLLFAACDQFGGGWDDLLTETGDTAFDTPTTTTPLIDTLSYGCDAGSPDEWWFDSVVTGWAGDMVVDIYETGDGNWPNRPTAVWDETHFMNNVESAEDRSWDRWDLVLADVESAGSQVSGRTTLFSCRWDDGRSLAFKATVLDESGRTQDCAIWGHESEQYFNEHLNNDCVCFESDNNCRN